MISSRPTPFELIPHWAIVVVISIATIVSSTHTYADYVTVVVHEARSLTNADGGGSDDIYVKVKFQDESRPESICDLQNVHRDGVVHVRDDWTCTTEFAPDVENVRITIELWEHDGTVFTGADDHFDITPVAGNDVVMSLELSSQNIVSTDIPGFATPACATGQIRIRGNSGTDFAEIVFSVTSSPTPTGDTDQDGLLDSWEICGTTGVNLPALGADPNHKDVFLEIDWMEDTDHSHSPWLTSLINLWEEFNAISPLDNPDGAEGIHLHIDVGNLYSGYALNVDTDSEIEINLNDAAQGGRDINGDGVNESLDLNDDGVIDIGNLAALEGAPTIGGEQIAEVDSIDTTGTTLVTLPDGSVDSTNSLGPEFSAIRSFSVSRLGVFRYAIFGHDSSYFGCEFRGVAECTSIHGCDEMLLSLGSRSEFQLVLDEETGNPIPDAGELLGPSGLPVFGTFDEQTHVLMHELGHTMGLRHGGIDDVSRKPNFISAMNYIFSAVDGIPMANNEGTEASRLNQDWNRDTFSDNARFVYSPIRAVPLNEQHLDETLPLFSGTVRLNTIDRVAMTSFGPPVINDDGDSELIFVRSDGRSDACTGLDWTRDDICSSDVAVDINNFNTPPTCGSITWSVPDPNEVLTSVSQADSLALNGIGIASQNAVLTGISYDERDSIRSSLRRIRALNSEEELANQCTTELNRADFDTEAVGPISADEYGEWLLITSAPGGIPTVISAAEREDMPTSSGDLSLLNNVAASSNIVPTLILDFPRPARRVGFFAGYSNRHSTGIPEVLASAYDVRGRKMGTVRKKLTHPAAGVSTYVGLSSMLPGDPIARVVVDYRLVEPDQLIHVDDITACLQTESIEPPRPAIQPEVSARQVPAIVSSELIVELHPVGDEPGHALTEMYELPNVPMSINGITHPTRHTEYTLVTDELSVSAPDELALMVPGASFRNWRLDRLGGQSMHQPIGQATLSWETDFVAEAIATYTPSDEQCMFRVNTESDLKDINPGDGHCGNENDQCSLRAALQEANTASGSCLVLLPGGEYGLSTPGREEDQSATGDLDVKGNITILGSGAERSIIDGSRQADTVLHVLNNATALISGITIRGGNGQGYPGGISNDGRLSLHDCAIVNNRSSGNAGGIWNEGSMLVNRCVVADNVAKFNGGGIYTRRGSTNIVETAVRNNRTNKFDGAGIANNNGTVTIERSSLTGNSAGRSGGGIWSDSKLQLKNVTVSSNEANSVAGIHIVAGTGSLSAVTVVNNKSSSDAGAGIANKSAIVRMANSLVAGNSGEGGGFRDCTGQIESLGFNLVENPTDCELTGSVDSVILNQSPRLLPLARSINSLTRSHELSHVSPAIDAGGPTDIASDGSRCSSSDQLSAMRPIGLRCDIGAREYIPY